VSMKNEGCWPTAIKLLGAEHQLARMRRHDVQGFMLTLDCWPKSDPLALPVELGGGCHPAEHAHLRSDVARL